MNVLRLDKVFVESIGESIGMRGTVWRFVRFEVFHGVCEE